MTFLESVDLLFSFESNHSTLMRQTMFRTVSTVARYLRSHKIHENLQNCVFNESIQFFLTVNWMSACHVYCFVRARWKNLKRLPLYCYKNMSRKKFETFKRILFLFEKNLTANMIQKSIHTQRLVATRLSKEQSNDVMFVSRAIPPFFSRLFFQYKQSLWKPAT